MSQKSSAQQSAQSVSLVLTPDTSVREAQDGSVLDTD